MMMGLCMKYAKLMVVVVLVGQLLVAPALGSGPKVDLVALPIWNFTVINDTICSVFRNKTALLPFFKVWPEDIPDLRFKYCCEYQADDLNSQYNLSTYRYGEGEGALEPRPYYDLGIVDQYKMYWKHWMFWSLPLRHNAVSIRCDMTDLQRLYQHRFWKTMARGATIGAVSIGCLLILVLLIFLFECCVPSDEHSRVKNFKFEELFSDVLHLLLLAFMGSLMMEAVGHSRLRGWRSQIMYNTGVVYTYLSLFAFVSACARHLVWPSRHHVKDWRWQKVFGQLGALFLMGAYLNLVDDPSGQALDSYAGIVLAAVVVACIWSSGVEMLVIAKMVTPLTDVEKEKNMEATMRRR